MIDEVADCGCNSEMLFQPEREALVVRRSKRVGSDKLGKSERIQTVVIKVESVLLNYIH